MSEVSHSSETKNEKSTKSNWWDRLVKYPLAPILITITINENFERQKQIMRTWHERYPRIPYNGRKLKKNHFWKSSNHDDSTHDLCRVIWGKILPPFSRHGRRGAANWFSTMTWFEISLHALIWSCSIYKKWETNNPLGKFCIIKH